MVWLAVYAGVVTILCMVFAFFFIHQRKKFCLEKQNSERKRLEIMFSQIKPHFIYNVLNTIYYLCEEDTGRAQEAIEDFSDYLRGNLESVGSEACIPFEQEMKHVDTYLHLEKLRFGEDLQITQDIQVEDFELPALTLQPLVENAVKHGVQSSENGGTVSIGTKRENGEIQIVISNSGGEYNPHYLSGENERRTHVGLKNTRERLRIMCNGTVDIYTNEGQGTRVVVRIPEQNGGKT